VARKSEDTEAKRRIIREWDIWAAKHVPSDRKATGTDGLIFFTYLQREGSDLLDFKTGDVDRWQIVKTWLIRERKIIAE
jgi:hypothetical protein